MTQIVMINSFRGGTGKSTITSNLAAYLASQGKKVIIIDTDIASPSIHNLFGLKESDFSESFSDYLYGKVSIEEAVYDISGVVKLKDNSLLFVPASTEIGMVLKTVNTKKNSDLLRKALSKLTETHNPDFIFIDTHPGINEEVLLASSLVDKVLTIVRPDYQDIQGVKVSAEVTEKLGNLTNVILNKLHKKLDAKKIMEEIEVHKNVRVVGAIPFDEEVMYAGSRFLLVLENSEHKFSQVIKRIADKVFNVKTKEKLEIMYELLLRINKNKIIGANSLKNAVKISETEFQENCKLLTSKGFAKFSNGNFVIQTKGINFLDNYSSISQFISEFRL